MNWRAIRAIIRRDLLGVSRSKGVLLPIIIVPLVIMVLIPLGVGLAVPAMGDMPGVNMGDMETFIAQMPQPLLAELEGLDEMQTIVVAMLVYIFAPMYLILPLMVASVIAADSFAGEKERKTLEALVYTPTTDLELFAGKLLSAWLPAGAVAILGFVAYALSANIGAWSTMGRVFFPNLMWVILVLWVAPAAAGLGLSSMVLVSARANTFQEAYQIGGVVVLPIVMLMVGQAMGVLYFGAGMVAALGAVLWLIDALLIWLGVRTFQRSEIIARL
jgi:ABC-2 type transport system permease protein